MAGELESVSEADSQEKSAAAKGKRPSQDESADFRRQIEKEKLGRAKQDREERKIYAERIFVLVAVWLAVIVSLLVAQGLLGPTGWFALSDAVLIAVATTTTASVTALLVVVARYLFPRS